MLKKIIQLKELGLPILDLKKSPDEIKKDIISYIFKANNLDVHVNLDILAQNYLFGYSLDQYLNIKDIIFLLRNTTTNYYTDKIIKKYFSDEKSAETVINEYKNNHHLFKESEVHRGIVIELYLKYKEISDEEFVKRRDAFYKKYQPITLMGRVYNQTKPYTYPSDINNIQDMRIYNGAWFLLKAIFTFYNDKELCIRDFFSKPIEHNYNSRQEWVRTKLDYSLDNITDILTGLRARHHTFFMDNFFRKTFKILDSIKATRDIIETEDFNNINEDYFTQFPEQKTVEANNNIYR
jgi:hypothetical protein